MTEYIKDKHNKIALQKSEIVKAEVLFHRNDDATIFFTLKNSDKVHFDDYSHESAKKFINDM